jgi:hypothetical protein
VIWRSRGERDGEGAPFSRAGGRVVGGVQQPSPATTSTSRSTASRPADDRRDRTPSIQKILVVGISNDREIRNRFEDKFVSHIRGRGKGAIASHELVPSLTEIPDRDKILAAIDKEGVDSVMTVRAVGLDDIEEKDWIASWEAWVGKNPTSVRELIERTLPVPKKRPQRHGIEFALWETRPATRLLWVGRSGSLTRKDLKAGAVDLIQAVIDDLKDVRWI